MPQLDQIRHIAGSPAASDHSTAKPAWRNRHHASNRKQKPPPCCSPTCKLQLQGIQNSTLSQGCQAWPPTLLARRQGNQCFWLRDRMRMHTEYGGVAQSTSSTREDHRMGANSAMTIGHRTGESPPTKPGRLRQATRMKAPGSQPITMIKHVPGAWRRHGQSCRPLRRPSCIYVRSLMRVADGYDVVVAWSSVLPWTGCGGRQQMRVSCDGGNLWPCRALLAQPLPPVRANEGAGR